MADGVDDTADAPVAAAALASPPAVAVLAPPAPSPPSNLVLLRPPSTQDDGTPCGTPSLPCVLQECIQRMVRERIKRNWPFVRAFECRSSNASCWNLGLQVGEWVLFKSLDQGTEQILVGQILQLQVAKRVMLQTDSWGRQSSSKSRCTTKCQGLCTLSNGRQWPAACVTCAHVIFWQWGFPTWSQWRACHFRGLLASLRRPAWRRRLGPAYVMDGGVQARLSSLGPLTEMVPGPIAE